MALFRVNMPLLYGEGGFKAFRKLQSQIMKQSSDDSILAFTTGDERYSNKYFIDSIASGPKAFQNGYSIHTSGWGGDYEPLKLSSETESAGLNDELPGMSLILDDISTAFEEAKDHFRLTAPILTSGDLYRIIIIIIIDLTPLEAVPPSLWDMRSLYNYLHA
ncbi:hypothetical protein QBC38DRAFT_498133 [Podospora fimiseda]|uniref:Uncharacterized protein n=1 Tax=Podospora fimiseda TaxID=252190 RepID=A0AAN7BTP5_9PEZI|nr:hypothetical protein QBC38DRAFT_498133 [Podospora fimiseda]